MTGWYLLDHHVNRSNGLTKPWYTTRNKPIRFVVIHTAENLPDWKGEDSGAEAVAKFGAGTTRASWHQTVDSDSTVPMLPDTYTAWHVRGHNSEALGVEIATRAGSWDAAPTAWKSAVMIRLADLVRQWCKDHNIPVKHLTQKQIDAGEKGIVGHYQLDPSRRTDPGASFDWDLLIDLILLGEDNMAVEEHNHNLQVQPEWSVALWGRFVKAGITTVAKSWAWAATRTDIAWLWDTTIRPLEERVKELEEATPTTTSPGPSVQAVADELARRLLG